MENQDFPLAYLYILRFMVENRGLEAKFFPILWYQYENMDCSGTINYILAIHCNSIEPTLNVI